MGGWGRGKGGGGSAHGVARHLHLRSLVRNGEETGGGRVGGGSEGGKVRSTDPTGRSVREGNSQTGMIMRRVAQRGGLRRAERRRLLTEETRPRNIRDNDLTRRARCFSRDRSKRSKMATRANQGGKGTGDRRVRGDGGGGDSRFLPDGDNEERRIGRYGNRASLSLSRALSISPPFLSHPRGVAN